MHMNGFIKPGIMKPGAWAVILQKLRSRKTP
jgi:hypothetical protein